MRSLPLFHNTSEVYGHDESVPYPSAAKNWIIELGNRLRHRARGQDISVEEAPIISRLYNHESNWSARDFQRGDMNSIWVLARARTSRPRSVPGWLHPTNCPRAAPGSGASESYDMTMLARVDGKEIFTRQL